MKLNLNGKVIIKTANSDLFKETEKKFVVYKIIYLLGNKLL